MRKFTERQFRAMVMDMLKHDNFDFGTDNEGQVIIYTDFWFNADGDVQEEPDPNYRKE